MGTITEILTLQVQTIRTIEVKTVISMNKAILALLIAVVICLLGDPGMQYLAKLGSLKFEEIAAAISLLSMPWMTS